MAEVFLEMAHAIGNFKFKRRWFFLYLKMVQTKENKDQTYIYICFLKYEYFIFYATVKMQEIDSVFGSLYGIPYDSKVNQIENTKLQHYPYQFTYICISQTEQFCKVKCLIPRRSTLIHMGAMKNMESEVLHIQLYTFIQFLMVGEVLCIWQPFH